jgi:hypothetical protein
VNAAEAAKSPGGDADALEVGQFDTLVVSDHHVLNVAFAIDEGSDLPARFVREFAQLASEFRCHNLIGRYAPGVQLFDAPQLIWF